ncbi:MAG: methyltransferase domain-containing protein [Acidobacteria bacterium]|nr:MAG: methyltransferase domain-containing protein [Acidobacteriota bacterium]
MQLPTRLLLVSGLAVAGLAFGWQEKSVKPGINEEYHRSANVERFENQFESEGREVFDRRADILRALNIQAGMEVADIGTGTGLFVPLFSKAVGPSGRVYAVDISPQFVEHVRREAKQLGLTNVETVLCTDRSVNLPAESIDLAFLCDVYHHFEFPQDSLASIRSALRPSGTLVVVDFHRITGKSPSWRLEHVRAGEEKFTAEIQAAGFDLVEELDFLKDNYFLRFRKR